MNPLSTAQNSNPDLGRWFVKSFRWFMLLWLGLTITKGIEGLAWRTHNHAQFDSEFLVVFGPTSTDWLPNRSFNCVYLAGILQLFITLSFAVRYIPAFIDPIERFAHLDTGETLTRSLVRARLQQITPRHVAFVFVISAVEYLLLVHASMSFHDLRQWLNFLLLLVICDSLFFLSGNLFWNGIKIAWEGLRMWTLVKLAAIMRRFSRNGSAVFDTHLAGEKLVAEQTISRLRRVVRTYGIWNTLDLLIVSGGLFATRLLPAGAGVSSGARWTEFFVLIALSAVILLETWRHFRHPMLQATYRRHLQLFALA